MLTVEEFDKLQKVENSKNIAVDFDGVIHKSSKGYHDGTIYDEPIDGAKEALQKLSEKNRVILYTCKARSDRALVNGKTGTELVWDWLEKHGMSQYVAEVTAEKPRALVYIDDRAIEFRNWDSCFDKLEKMFG